MIDSSLPKPRRVVFVADNVLKAAFAANDLSSICKPVDTAVQKRGVASVALHAKVDRTTLFRAFRQENGPSLDTMVSVLHAFDCRLIVEPRKSSESGQPQSKAVQVARMLANGFRSGDLDLAISALATALRSQSNISAFVRIKNVSRENLYRSFAFPRVPRFRTVLIFLDALGLQFGIERLPIKDSGIAPLQAVRTRVALR